jgi:hypothetical protein
MNTEINNAFNKLEYIKDLNFDCIEMMSSYLTNNPRFITEDMIRDLKKSLSLKDKDAFLFLFAAACDMDVENNPRHKELFGKYFRESVAELSMREFSQNQYYQMIDFPDVSMGDWTFQHNVFQPYEAFIYDDIKVFDDYREVPKLGFFTEEFRYPAVLENNNEWMMITPEETMTIKKAISKAAGDVITFGLGLGYYPFMVSQKNNVSSVTVIEKDPTVIELFRKYILPQFPNKEKVHVIEADGFEYAENELIKNNFSFSFVDMWHDASDGLSMYIRMKAFEKYNPNITYDYWIEDTLISRLRWFVFDTLKDSYFDKRNDHFDIPGTDNLKNDTDLYACLSDGFLKQMSSVISPLLLDNV